MYARCIFGEIDIGGETLLKIRFIVPTAGIMYRYFCDFITRDCRVGYVNPKFRVGVIVVVGIFVTDLIVVVKIIGIDVIVVVIITVNVTVVIMKILQMIY